jgi:DNA-binding protein YbaB
MGGSDLFDLSRLRELQREAADLARRLSAASTAAEAEFVGSDSAGVVEITIGSDGAPTRVRLDSGWRQVVGITGLGAAVIAALTAAVTERLSAWAGGMAPAGDGRPAALDTEPYRHAELGDPSSRQSALALRDLMALVDDVTARLPEVAQAAEAATTASVTATNGGRTVRVTTVGGMVSAVDFDEQWLRSADHQRIEQAIQEALTTSVRDCAQARLEAFAAVPGLDRVRALTASPETLLREIGLLK